MDQQAFAGIAHRGALGLGIHQNGQGLFQVGVLVHIDMAVAGTGFDHRDSGVFHCGADQAGAAPGNEHIQIARELHKGGGSFPGGVLHQSDAVGVQPGFGQSLAHQLHQTDVGAENILGAPEDHRIARFQAEHGGIHGDIGTGFIDHAHHAQGHPHLGNDQSIGQGLGVEHFSDGVLEGSHLAYPFHDASQTLFVQEHPVEQVGGDAGSLAGGNIFRIGCKDFRGVFFQGTGNGFQGGILGGSRSHHQSACGPAGIFAQADQVSVHSSASFSAGTNRVPVKSPDSTS